MSTRKVQAQFVNPMLLLPVSDLPEGEEWVYELKLDGYRGLGIKTGGEVLLRSRNNKDFNLKYPAIASALKRLPNESVIDGELVAFDPSGRPSFNALQNFGSSTTPIFFYAFDLLMLAGKDVMSETLDIRRELLRTKVLAKLSDPIRYSSELEAPLPDLIKSVKEHGFEGLVAKNYFSKYEPGQRSGVWRKMRVNRGQEFVIGGYTLGAKSFDALVFGYYEGNSLIYVARTRNGFTPSIREQLASCFRALTSEKCPFVNLPEAKSGRWGQGLTAAKMKDCRWLKPELVGQFEFAEWTPENHLRHSRFISLREDKDPRQVRKE